MKTGEIQRDRERERQRDAKRQRERETDRERERERERERAREANKQILGARLRQGWRKDGARPQSKSRPSPYTFCSALFLQASV